MTNKITIQLGDGGTTSMQINSSANSATLATRGKANWLALGAVTGPILFTLAWFILGFVNTGYTLWDIVVESYSPISQPISGLGLGNTAPFMNAAFIFCGLLIMIGAIGIFQSIREMASAARWRTTVLLAPTGLGMIVSGIFTLETIIPHTAGFVIGTGTPVVGFVVIGLSLRRIPRWRQLGSWLLLGSPITLVLLVLSFASFDPVAAGAGIGVAGLTQRILVSEIFAWIAAIGWKAFRGS